MQREKRTRFALIVTGGAVVGSVAGCVPTVTVAPDSALDVQPIVLVVEDVYRELGQAASVYVGVDAADAATVDQAKIALQSDLQTTVRSPSDRISGEPGGSVALGRFRVGDDGRVTVVASFVNENGSNRGCVAYALEHDGDAWSIAGMTDVWPNCPISDYGTESYHDALERARSNECLRLGTGVGTCGPWLYVFESSGLGGTRSYYDWQTGLLAAREQFSDADEVADLFVFGHVDCEPTVTETIPCDE